MDCIELLLHELKLKEKETKQIEKWTKIAQCIGVTWH